LSPAVEVAAAQPHRAEEAHRPDRKPRQAQERHEQAAKRGAGEHQSLNLYPNPRTVSTCCPPAPSFLRMAVMWTSMVRSKMAASRPRAESMISSRLTTLPGRPAR